MTIHDKLEKEEAAADELWKDIYEEKPEEPQDVSEKTEAEVEEVKEVKEAEVIEEIKEPTEPPKDKPERDLEYWKSKFQTIEGKYRAEVPRLSAEIAQWKNHSTELEGRIKVLETKKEPEPEELTDFEETYPDFAKILKKQSAKYEAEIAEIREQLNNNLTADINSVKADINVSRQERFNQQLDSVVPGWKQIDADPEFIAWLNEPAPYTKNSKLELIQNAARNLDADTVSQFFLDFKGGEVKQKSNVAPPRSSGPAAPRSGTPQTLTREQYEKFMNPRGRFNPDDWGGKTERQVEIMFDAAIKKGLLY